MRCGKAGGPCIKMSEEKPKDELGENKEKEEKRNLIERGELE